MHTEEMASDHGANVPERASGFRPTAWGDFFINYSPDPLQSEEWTAERVNQLKEKICGLFEACTTTVEQLNLVDTLQHLSIDHHFNNQINSVLTSAHGAEFTSACLHDVALRFRLLRQQGFWVSPDEFNRFKDKHGNFDVGITNDARGLLSLYNAAHLFTHGEAELEEAILFARQHLESMRNNLEYPLAQQVNRALLVPLPRTVRRLEALHYISEYKESPAHDPSLLEFAQLDFDLLQRLHLKELKALSRWWKDLYNEGGLTYSRDRVVECYLWSYTAYYEKEHSRARMILAKIIALIILIDDTYDVRATLEECRKFNEAIQRWEESAISLLPDYLKTFYLKLMNIFKEFEDELETHEKYRVAFSRKAFQILSSNYLQEAEWFHGGYKPTFEDQVKISTVCSGAPFASVGLLVGMGDDVATEEALEWAISCTDAVKAFAEVTRFMNDLASFKHGKNKNDVDSSVECYISEHGVTTEVAFAKINSLIEDAWKTINRARFENNELLPVVQRVANITASMPLIYGDNKDAFTFSDGLKGVIQRLFLKPILL
ncbi:hypothetical protein SORBI_3006G247500 [Sorghum bicolor]|uniref:Uncharacterized protein n=1 Tax=Sorghum bicolor TaxID=4558 RepID=A0A1Z5RFE6_SORBI|nr:hypothetical protein SORBI_3006G247500 [Sorghum bicolor]OQU82483.1 hypothetical protein SORBI_3006G247500 [Sorghum bicolor]OQU82485.1 hypothetical protein SORBI_3006G247500 [Sorghum bicolor]